MADGGVPPHPCEYGTFGFVNDRWTSNYLSWTASRPPRRSVNSKGTIRSVSFPVPPCLSIPVQSRPILLCHPLPSGPPSSLSPSPLRHCKATVSLRSPRVAMTSSQSQSPSNGWRKRLSSGDACRCAALLQPRQVADAQQALIDFDGWRRWKGSDLKNAGETKRGFSIGPQAAARNLASRLRIERKPGSRPAEPPLNPAINVQAATPGANSSIIQSDPLMKASTAATSLESARSELVENKLSAVGLTQMAIPPSETAPSASQVLSAINEDLEASPAIKSTALPRDNHVSASAQSRGHSPGS